MVSRSNRPSGVIGGIAQNGRIVKAFIPSYRTQEEAIEAHDKALEVN